MNFVQRWKARRIEKAEIRAARKGKTTRAQKKHQEELKK